MTSHTRVPVPVPDKFLHLYHTKSKTEASTVENVQISNAVITKIFIINISNWNYYFIPSINWNNIGGGFFPYVCPSKYSVSVNNERILTKFGNGFYNKLGELTFGAYRSNIDPKLHGLQI
jgi:hypothetical protein